jgi:hypothetical protein
VKVTLFSVPLSVKEKVPSLLVVVPFLVLGIIIETPSNGAPVDLSTTLPVIDVFCALTNIVHSKSGIINNSNRKFFILEYLSLENH